MMQKKKKSCVILWHCRLTLHLVVCVFDFMLHFLPSSAYFTLGYLPTRFSVCHTHTHTKQTAWTTTENSYLLPTLSLPNMDAINSFWTYSFSPLTQEINWRIKQPSKQWFKVGGCVLGVWLSPGLACDKSVGAEMSSSNWMLIKGKCHGESGSAFGLEHFIAGLVWYYIGDVTTDTAGYPRTDYAIDIQLMQQISRQNSDVISLLWMATMNCFGINFTRAL